MRCHYWYAFILTRFCTPRVIWPKGLETWDLKHLNVDFFFSIQMCKWYEI